MDRIKRETINGYEIASYVSESKTENYDKCKELLKLTLITTETFNKKHTSYGMKHKIEDIIGDYVSNYDVKCAMSELGYYGIQSDKDSINYYYRISEKWFEFIENLANNCNKNKKKLNIDSRTIK